MTTNNQLQIISTKKVIDREFNFYGSWQEPLFLAKDVAAMLGLTNVTDMVSRVDEDEVTKLNLGSKSGEAWFLTEDGLYEVLMQSRKPIAKVFKKEVKNILKQIRCNGGYIAPTATEEQIDNLKRFSSNITIKTFGECDPIELPKLITEFNEYIAALPTATKLTRYKSALKGISRMKSLITEETVHYLAMIQKHELDITKQMHILENRSNGGQKSHQTRLIKQLQANQNTLPDISHFHKLNVHGFSNNYMYGYSEGRPIRTKEYNYWINNFPVSELPDYLDFNPSQPARIIMYFTAKPDYDVNNFCKSFIDRLQDLYGFNDNCFKETTCKLYQPCNSYKEGEIYFFIENIAEEEDNLYA